MTITKAALVFAVGLCSSACGGAGSSPTTPTSSAPSGSYSSVTASVSPPVLPAGDTAFASLEGRTTQGGLAIVSVPVSRWTSSNPSVATVTNTGNVTAVAPGTAALTATFDGGSQAATVAVFGDRDIEGLTVTCGDIPPGVQGVFCTVAARTRLGSGPVKATWRSSRPDVGSLATDGSTPSVAIVVQRVTPGQTVITATYGTFTATATVEVRP